MGIDILTDARMLGSLETLAAIRGESAHMTTRGVQKHRNPKDTINLVKDCLHLAEEM